MGMKRVAIAGVTEWLARHDDCSRFRTCFLEWLHFCCFFKVSILILISRGGISHSRAGCWIG